MKCSVLSAITQPVVSQGGDRLIVWADSDTGNWAFGMSLGCLIQESSVVERLPVAPKAFSKSNIDCSLYTTVTILKI